MADQHAIQILRLSGVELVATCDTEPLMARQMAERFNVPAWYTDVDEMLASARPDVVHVTTPPQSHLSVGRKCIAAGAHAYIEKPFTLNTADAIELIELANQKGVRITAGHNAQFTHAMCQMRCLINEGYLGGRVVHMESLYCYEFGDPGYAKALLADKDHWARKLPGSLPQNIISHGVAKIAELMKGDASFSEVITRDKLSRLHLVNAGRPGFDRALLQSPRLTLAIDAMLRVYEHVLLDAGTASDLPAELLTANARAVVVPDASMAQDARKVMCDQLRVVGFSEVDMLSEPARPSNARETATQVAAA